MNAMLLSQDAAMRRKREDVVCRQPDAIQCSDELNRLLSAAVVSKSFCRQLLASPLAAATNGYCGYYFDLPEQESNLLATIRSVSLDDFARQLISRLSASQHASESKNAGEFDYSIVPTAHGELAIRL